MKGINHWKVNEVVIYEPKNKSTFEYKINKNIYGEKIKGRPIRVIAQLIQIYVKQKYELEGIELNLKWLEIVRTLSRIKTYLWNWKINGYRDLEDE